MGGKAALILVMGFSFILGYISLNLSRIANKSVGNMSTYATMTSSNQLAKTGANVALAKFYGDTTWFGTISQTFTGNPLTYKGSFSATTTKLDSTRVRLRSVSSYIVDSFTTLHDTVEVYFNRNRKSSFSLFAWMTNNEGGVNWTTADTVWGRVHSNGTIYVNGKPAFMEKVTTSKSFSPKPGTGTNNAIFKHGYETGVATIDFPSDLTDLINASNAGGKHYPDSAWITLSPGTAANGDGKVYVRHSSAGAIFDSISLADTSFNGVIVANKRAHVQGTLDGLLTVASLTDAYVENDVKLAANPLTGPSDDMMGLVAENNVIVANNVANATNCSIEASVFTRTGSFSAQNYNAGPLFGTLNLTGSIVQNTRGAVGTISGGVLVTGFSKRYKYDTRLADPNVRPPHYPGFYVKTYAITNWWESYSVALLNK